MWILALDCSTEWCSVAVGDGRRWHVLDEHVGQAHSERLLPMVSAALAEGGLTLDRLAGIAFGAGAGSSATDGWRGLRAPEVTPPAAVRLPGAAGAACGAGGGFAAYPALASELMLREVDAGTRPAARAIGELALPRFAKGEGVAAADALPFYVRHRVALTTAERDAGVRL